MSETTNTENGNAVGGRLEALVIFLRSLFTRTYFYSGNVHLSLGNVTHIDGVLEITSFRRQPKLAWNTARRDVMRAMDCDAASVHLHTLTEI